MVANSRISKLKKGILLTVFSVSALIIGAMFSTSKVSAYGTEYKEDWITWRFLVEGFRTCYNGGHMKRNVNISGAVFDGAGYVAINDGQKVVTLPSIGGDDTITCTQLLNGSKYDIYKYGGTKKVSRSSSTEDKIEFMKNLTYKEDPNAETEKQICGSLVYTKTAFENNVAKAPMTIETQQICANIYNDGTVVDGQIFAGKPATDFIPSEIFYTIGSDAVMYSNGAGDVTARFDEDHTFEETLKTILPSGTKTVWQEGATTQNQGYRVQYDFQDYKVEVVATSQAMDFVGNPLYTSDALKNVLGWDKGEFGVTVDETISLYQWYLNTYATDMVCTKSTEMQSAIEGGTGSWTGYEKTHLVVDGEYRSNCYVKMVQTKDLNNLTGGTINAKEIVGFLKGRTASSPGSIISANVRDLDDEENQTHSGNSYENGDVGSDVTGDPSTKCYKSADVLGHILCPILSAVSQFTDSIYYYIENNFLMTNAQALTGDDVRGAWSIVRDIANVCFVIVLLVIIFSQVTGIGIDNYGIKRLLPRLIVMAIMVNISFLICQVLVDVSNILGVNLKQFLSGAVTLNATGENSGAIAATGILETVAGGGILVGLTFLNPGIILALVASIIGVVIGLLFLFIILIARQIAIVVLIVLSPIAFICYMLPNTEKYFGTWRKAFTALLVVYPICSLAMGGGTMVANVLANAGDINDNAVLLIGAMITNVVPFFFIPTLLQNSLAALGGLGARISGLGQRLGRGVGNFAAEGIKRTRGFNNLSLTSKQFQDEHLRKGEKRMLERRAARLNNIMKENNGKLSAGQQRRLALAQSRLNAMNTEDATAEAGIKAKDYDTLLAGAQSRRLQEDIADIKAKSVNEGLVNNMTGNKNFTGMGDDYVFGDNTLEAALYNAAASGDQAAMLAYADQLSEKGHAGQEGLGQVLSKLEANGKEGAARSIAQSIMNGSHSGEYKKGARSQYDHMKELAGGKSLAELGNIRDLSKIQAKSYSKESLANADKEELSRIAEAIKQGKLGDNEVKKFQELASGALADSRIEGGTKLENEKLLQGISNNTIQVHQPADTGNRPTENGRFTRLTNDQLLEVATRPGVDAGTADRAMAEVERRQKDGTMKV